LSDIIVIGRKYDIPVIVDAAAQVPPVKNLHRFIDMGADLVSISGGKGIRGPQGSGILCGRKDLIASAVLQSLDMAGEPFDLWDPPRDLIPKEKLKGKPEHGIGRGCKVTKEEIVGLLSALESFTEENFAALSIQLKGFLNEIIIKDIDGIRTQIIDDYPGGYPMLDIAVDASTLGKNAWDIFEWLKRDGILVRDRYLDDGRLLIHTINMNEASVAMIAEHLYSALS
jgi:D-glucosaminate-6-phosphate ammonia-lyase